MLIQTNRALIRLAGTDTIALLERTVTNSVSSWEAGTARYGALLTPQGKIISDFIALRTEHGVELELHAEAAADMEKRLRLFRLRSKVEIDVQHGHVHLGEGGMPDPRSPNLPTRTFLSGEGDPSSGTEGWDRSRIAQGVPEWGADFASGDVFPTDVNMDVMGGIDYKKGCFVGQEVASRMKRRGTIRKRTVLLTVAGAKTGDSVRAGTAIGEVTSAHSDQALARIRTDRLANTLAAGEPITIGDGALSAEVQFPEWLSREMEAAQP